MIEYSAQNKEAWEYNVYDFWLREAGAPSERAKRIVKDPIRELKWYSGYFDTFENVRVANICGSCGKKAVPLAVLGAEVTVFDISEDNRKYALELAQAAQVHIGYEVCDVMQIDMDRYRGYFDIVFMEGGVLHYFHDIGMFMDIMYELLKPGGKMICSDFHPLTKVTDVLNFGMPARGYFDAGVFEGEMPHAKFYDTEIREKIPKCKYRKFTLSEIINAVISSGFTLRRFDEHPAWTNRELPGEFTVVAVRDDC